MAPVLTSISPISGPPGSAITCVGSGFTATSQVGCPTLVPTTYVDGGTVTAEIPADMGGPDGGGIVIAVYVRNAADGSVSAMLQFTVLFGARRLQSWTTVEAVAGEIPNFTRGGKINDGQIQTWIRSVAQEITAAMLRRGLSLDPAQWQQAIWGADPDPVDVLEMVNRMGAGARLASAVGAQFSAGGGEWGPSKNMRDAYLRQLEALKEGAYDKLFRPGAATIEAGRLLMFGDTSDARGHPGAAFDKEQIF